MSRGEVVKNVLWAGDNHPMRRMLLWFSILSVVALALLFVDWLFRNDTFPVEQVSFEGEFNNVTQKELEQTIAEKVHGNYLIMSLSEIKTSLETIPWVYQVSVRRKWPSGIHISFIEQDIVAQWGEAAWLNQYGDTVQLNHKTSSLQFLPYLKGPEGTNGTVFKKYEDFSKVLDSAGLKLQGLVYGNRGSWTMMLADGVEIILGKQQSDSYLQRFARVYPQALSDRSSMIKRIDLRYTNGFAVAWTNVNKNSAESKMNHNYQIGPNKG